MKVLNSELFLVMGVMVGVLAVPALFSAAVDGRPPRAGAILVLVAGTLIVLALEGRPGGYDMADIPRAFSNVFGRLLR
ncbi:hypothetical protein [Rhodobacter sp. NSM]|uniref:hypothetical protein n=1 Tax=Rhodobacter sp. NSM TaxID=3457501 RepID=UPI003FCF563E